MWNYNLDHLNEGLPANIPSRHCDEMILLFHKHQSKYIYIYNKRLKQVRRIDVSGGQLPPLFMKILFDVFKSELFFIKKLEEYFTKIVVTIGLNIALVFNKLNIILKCVTDNCL